MAPERRRLPKSYRNEEFLASREARSLRLLAEYLKPQRRFVRYKVEDIVFFMDSARTLSHVRAKQALRTAEESKGDISQARYRLQMTKYYEAARELARRLTE